MDSFVTDTQALVKFMMGKKVINEPSHKAYQAADIDIFMFTGTVNDITGGLFFSLTGHFQ